MEPMSIAATAAVVMNYVAPAIRKFGAKVLEKSEDAASGGAIGLGRRLLGMLLSGRGEPGRAAALEQGIERRVFVIISDPERRNAQIQLEGAIEDLLTAEPELLSAVRALLAKAPAGPDSPAVHQEDGSVFAGRDIVGSTVYAGRGNVYHAHEDPKEVAAKHFAAGEQRLALGLFHEAVEDFQRARSQAPADHGAYYMGAIAALDGRKAFRASLETVREVERLIHGAIELQDLAIYHYFLAYLHYDYYERKSLKAQGSWRGPYLEALKKGVTQYQIDSLFTLLSVENPLPGLR